MDKREYKERYKAQQKYTNEELKRLQALPLDEKIALSKVRIQEWYEYWQGKVFVSYSGGKDSTVLLKLIREMYSEVAAVYVDSGLDFPEIREHVKQTENVIRLKPSMTFREVLTKYGWLFPSKKVARCIVDYKRGTPYAQMYMEGKNYDGSPSPFNVSRYAKWKWLVDAPFPISDKCCKIIKEKPLTKYSTDSGCKPMNGTMASEGGRRKDAWLITGCNAFDMKNPISKPLSFWTEQDILRYIVDNGVEIPTVYGEIVEEKGRLTTTGEKRTGCMFCLIGCHLNKPNRFQSMKETHPNIYKYCMEQLGLEEVLTWLKIPH